MAFSRGTTDTGSNGTRLRVWTMISVGIARLLPPRSLPPWRSVHNQNAASVAPSPPCGLSAWSGVSKVFSREHRSTEASSVVAWRRRWVAFWWRTSLDGGKPRRGGKSPRGSLSSCHSTQGRSRPESGQSALLSAIASGPVARVRAEFGKLFRLALLLCSKAWSNGVTDAWMHDGEARATTGFGFPTQSANTPI